MEIRQFIRFLVFWSIARLGYCADGLQPREVAPCQPANTTARGWMPNLTYEAGSLVVFSGSLYQCLQTHASQLDWNPLVTPNLWATPTPCGVSPWKTQTLYQVGGTVTYEGRTYVCVQTHQSQKAWTPDKTPALWQVNRSEKESPICITTEVNGFTMKHMEVTTLSNSTGAKVTMIIDTAILASKISTSKHLSGSESFTLQVLIGSDEFFSQSLVFYPNWTVRGLIHWGTLVRGAKNATFTITNSTISGSIDNRPFYPFNTSQTADSVIFVDGGPSPNLAAVGGVNATLRDVQRILSAAAISCLNDSSAVNSSTAMMLVPRADRSQDAGHISQTYGSGGCHSCKALAMAGVIAAEVACVAGTCWWSFGIGCVACTAAAASAAVTAIAACEFSNPCCPITCGSGSFPFDPPLCCWGNELCLDGAGHCCSFGQQPCAGKACCNAGQSCIATGPQQGTCCPRESVCGNQCCPSDSQTCVANAICCNPPDVCGSKCCSPVDPLAPPETSTFFHLTCVDRINEVCCQSGQRSVGGVCCWPGQVVVDGICCAPGRVACNGECCLGICVNGRCRYSITSAECQAMGLEGSCADFYPSWNCASCYENGCCVPTPR